MRSARGRDSLDAENEEEKLPESVVVITASAGDAVISARRHGELAAGWDLSVVGTVQPRAHTRAKGSEVRA